MSEQMGIDVPEFQLSPARREWLRERGTLKVCETDNGGKMHVVEVSTGEINQVVDEDGTIIYFGADAAVRRERGMEAIEQTPAWVLRAIMQHAAGYFRTRDTAEWPETVWDVRYGIRQVLINNKVDDAVMPLSVRKDLVNNGSTLISRFLIREHPEYGETHFIGIRRPIVKGKDEDGQEQMLDGYGIDDYLFPELRDLTADTATEPSA